MRTPEPACRPLEVAEFPLLGGIRGTWMDDERFVLADLHQSRLLVYSTSEGLVRIVNGWESDDLELNFVSPMDIQPWGDGFVLADSFRDAERLFELDAALRPVRLLWEGDARRTEEGWVGEKIVNLGELVALDDRLYLRAERFSNLHEANRGYAEFGLHRRSDTLERALGERRAWPGFAGERDSPGMPFSHLAASGRRSASVYALRYSPAVFIQELAGEVRSLNAFPELPTPLPTLPQASQDRMAEFYAALEASSYPAGLYGDEDSLYVLMRDATGGEPGWDLHRIDPQRDEVIGRVRLPTKAAHVSLLPGRRYWVLEESSSGLDRSFRPPIRFLLLSSAALRAGEVPSCD
ncbi:MAG: hypothetical protein F4210_14380 [Holophagales bacterium]|nr:hypothetical protein [Holophagales bacterium]MYF96667.1 hypothetical protein [Holophagales bacterium]